MNREDLVRLHEVDEMFEPGKKLFKKQRWVTPEEGGLLLSIVEEEAPDHIFEVGTANGYSASWMGLGGCPITTYDIVERAKVWGDDIPPHITCVVSKFRDISPPEGKLLFFIDGHHTDVAVRGDLEEVLAIIKPGDVIVLHDANDRAPKRFYQRLEPQAASSRKYETKRGIGKLVWGTAKGDLDGKTTEV